MREGLRKVVRSRQNYITHRREPPPEGRAIPMPKSLSMTKHGTFVTW